MAHFEQQDSFVVLEYFDTTWNIVLTGSYGSQAGKSTRKTTSLLYSSTWIPAETSS